MANAVRRLTDVEERPHARILREALEQRRAPMVDRPVMAAPIAVSDPRQLNQRVKGRGTSILSHGKWLPKLPEPEPLQFSFQSPDISSVLMSGGTSSKGGGSAFDKLFNAIRAQESGGNYGARNRSSGALGAYQIMPSNLPSWSRAALGRSISASEFLRSPRLQDAIARHQMLQYYNKYGARGAAIAWYAGPGALKYSSGSLNRRQGAYPSINSYAASILRKAGL